MNSTHRRSPFNHKKCGSVILIEIGHAAVTGPWSAPLKQKRAIIDSHSDLKFLIQFVYWKKMPMLIGFAGHWLTELKVLKGRKHEMNYTKCLQKLVSVNFVDVISIIQCFSPRTLLSLNLYT